MNIIYKPISGQELSDIFHSNPQLIGGANKQLKYVFWEDVSKNTYTVGAFFQEDNSEKLVGLAALEDMRKFSRPRGLNVKYISLLMEYQKKGIGSQLAYHLALYTKSKNDCLTTSPVSEGGSALSSTWKKLSLELDLEIFSNEGSGFYIDVNEKPEIAQLFTYQAKNPKSVIIKFEDIEKEVNYCRAFTTDNYEQKIVVSYEIEKDNWKFLDISISQIVQFIW